MNFVDTLSPERLLASISDAGYGAYQQRVSDLL
jgi:hypothetical protein